MHADNHCSLSVTTIHVVVVFLDAVIRLDHQRFVEDGAARQLLRRAEEEGDWDSTMVNNSMSAPALLACKASARPPVALQSKELWLFQCVFYGKCAKMLTNSR